MIAGIAHPTDKVKKDKIHGDTMATFSTSEFKNGLKVLIDGEPCSILENEVVKPGKGQAFNRVRMRSRAPTSWKPTCNISTPTASFGIS